MSSLTFIKNARDVGGTTVMLISFKQVKCFLMLGVGHSSVGSYVWFEPL